MELWKRSPGHRENLLRVQATHVGIGAAGWNHDGKNYDKIVQVFMDGCIPPGRPAAEALQKRQIVKRPDGAYRNPRDRGRNSRIPLRCKGGCLVRENYDQAPSRFRIRTLTRRRLLPLSAGAGRPPPTGLNCVVSGNEQPSTGRLPRRAVRARRWPAAILPPG